MIDDLLMQLNRVRGVGGTLVLSNDGQVVSGVLRQDVDDTQLAAAVATAVGNVQRLGESLALGPASSLDLHGVKGSVLVLPVGSSWLAIAVDHGVNLALLQLESRPVVERIAAALTL